MFCTECGKQTEKGREFCAECSAKLGVSDEKENKKQPAKKTKESSGFSTLFDTSFDRFFSPLMIKFIFKLSVILSAIGGALVGKQVYDLMLWTTRSGERFIVAPAAGVLAFFVLLILARIWCEVLIVLFKIADGVGKIAKHGR